MIHPRKLTCPLKRDYFNRKYIFQPLIFSGHVSFPGSILYHSQSCNTNLKKKNMGKTSAIFGQKEHPFVSNGSQFKQVTLFRLLFLAAASVQLILHLCLVQVVNCWVFSLRLRDLCRLNFGSSPHPVTMANGK